MHWQTWWHAGGMWLFWLAALVVIGALVYLVARSTKKPEPSRESPEEILKERYARGEIDREEYEGMLRDLR